MLEKNILFESSFIVFIQVFMEPLKKVQVEGYMMFAEPEVLFGNLDELCCVSCFLKINPDLSDNFSSTGYLRFLQGVC